MASDDALVSEDTCANCQKWIADMGASHHMTNDERGLTNKRVVNDEKTVKVGDGSLIKITYTADFVGYYKYNNNNFKKLTLHDVSYSPDFCIKLFSITKAISQGMKLTNEGKTVIISDKTKQIQFNQYIETANGYLAYTHLFITPIQKMVYSTTCQVTIDIQQLHDNLGHPHMSILHQTAKSMNVINTGKLKPCHSCAMAKARQKDVPKTNEQHSNIAGERIYYDIIHVTNPSLSGSTYWVLIIDKAMRFKTSNFISTKDGLPNDIEQVINYYHTQEKCVKYMRADNAGENTKVQEECIKQGQKNSSSNS